MTALDRLLQAWRIRKAIPHIPRGARLLDIGAADASLFRAIPHLREYVGVEPNLLADCQLAANARLVRGFFPDCDLGDEQFDCITMLAVLEHIPLKKQPELAKECARRLKRNGRLIATVPSRRVDPILTILSRIRLIHGIALEQHYGYDVNAAPQLIASAGFRLVKHAHFQVGLNNLFVFVRDGD
jgi:SAM-dependent methyltransferase